MTAVSPARFSPAPQGGDRHQKERGFALLLIFFMAAAIAIMLYAQLPRVAFESERDKEQLLIDRGEQYKRAIALFYNDYKRYPSKIEDLEDTNGHRYLRRRYKDPYTGKDEWRLIHTNGQYLTDSLVQKPPGNPADCSSGTTQGVGPALTGNAVGSTSSANATGGTSSTSTTSTTGGTSTTSTTGGTSTASTTCSTGGAGATATSATPGATPATSSVNSTDPNAPPQVNAAVLTRPSDRPITPAGAFPGSRQGSSLQAAQNNSPSATGYIDPASYPPITLFPNGYNTSPQQPGAPQQGVAQQGVVQPGGFQQSGTTQPGQFQTGVPPGQFQTGVPPGQFQTGVPPGQFQNGVLPGQFPPVVQQPGQLTPVAQQTGIGALPPASTSSDPNQAPLAGVAGGVAPGFNTSPLAPGGPANPSQPGIPGGFAPVPYPLPNQQPANQQLPNPQTQTASVGAAPGAASNQALNLINQLLTTPRQPPSAVTAAPASNQTVGAGIAGVASTFTGPTIKSYAKHSKYQEWEFVFQLQQQGVPGQTANPLANPLGGTQNGGAQNGGTQNGAQTGGANGILSGPGTGFGNGPTSPTPGQSQSPNSALPPLQ
jgi:hypothetical protein